MKSRQLRRPTLLLLLLLLLKGHSASANVVGGDAQNFNPTTNGLDFVTVQSSETLKPGVLNFGFFLNYAVNTLPYQESNVNQTRVNFNDSLLGADLNFGVGILPGWDAGVSLPQVLSQSVETDTGVHGQFAQNGLTEVKANTKVRLMGDDSGGIALIASLNLNQTEDNPFTGINPGPTFNFEAAADRTFGAIAAGLNVGYRMRSPGDPVPGPLNLQPYSDAIIASGAMSYHFPDYDTKLIFELFGSMPTETSEFTSEREQSSLEALLGAKYDVTPNLAAHIGGGTEVMHGNASPDWRVYVGLNYTIGPLWGREPAVERDPPVEASLSDVPDEPFVGTPKAAVETFVIRDVLFKFDSDEIEESSEHTLDQLAQYLMRPPEFIRLEISGHTDSIGKATYNLDLSQRRARMVKRYLVRYHKIPEGRIIAHGYGEGVPIADNGNYQGRALNRRVEFKITRDMNNETSTSPPKEALPRDSGDPGMKMTIKKKKKAPAKKKKATP